MALAHDWEAFESDDGILGVNDYWRCRRCGADGGWRRPECWLTPPGPGSATVPGDGRGINHVSDDCEEASREMLADKIVLAFIDRKAVFDAMFDKRLSDFDRGRAYGWNDSGKELEPWQKGIFMGWYNL